MYKRTELSASARLQAATAQTIRQMQSGHIHNMIDIINNKGTLHQTNVM
jgi:hypothetical protein